MQDRFKFRIYCKSENEKILFNNPTLVDGDILQGGLLFKNYDHKIKNVHEVKPEDLILMQCTGLKDKNGKLIFEGDIIAVQYIGAQIPLFSRQFSNLPEDERFAIVYNYDWHKFCCENPNYKKTCEIHSLDLDAIQINTENKQYEIIGNIYENPELLKEQQ